MDHSLKTYPTAGLAFATLLLAMAPACAAQAQPGRHPQDAVREPYDIIAQGVDTRTRDYSYSHTDLALPGAIGPRVAVMRVFDANDGREGPFGVGWRLEIGPKTPASPNRSQDGTRYDYARQPDGASLLARVTDRHGNAVVYRYDGARLVGVETEYADRRHGYALTPAYSLAIRWNVSDPRHPRVTAIDSFQESPRRRRLQTVTYDYADGFARSVTGERSPGGKVTRYGYHRWTENGVAEDGLLCSIADADGAETRIGYNDVRDDSYEAWTQPRAGHVEAARVTDPAGAVTEFVPVATGGSASGTHLVTRHTERLPGGSEGCSVRSVWYVPDTARTWVVSGWHSRGVERLYDRSGLPVEEDDCAGFGWNRRVPARQIPPPRADMDYDDRYHFWTLVDMMHAVFWQDVFSPGVPHTQLLDGGIVFLRKTYAYDSLGRRIRETVAGFPFTPGQSLPESPPLVYTRRTAYWGPEKYGQKKLEIDPAGRRVYYDYCDSRAAPERRGNLRAVYADVSAGVMNGHPAAYDPFDRPLRRDGAAALASRPRAGAVPVLAIDAFDPHGLPKTVRTLEALPPRGKAEQEPKAAPRFAVERRSPAAMPLGVSESATVTDAHGSRTTATAYDALGRIVRRTVTQAGTTLSDVRTDYAHRGGDPLASDGETARVRTATRHQADSIEYRYTPGGRLVSASQRTGKGPLVRRTARYETRDGHYTGRLAELDESWDGAPRYRLMYAYGGYGNEDLIRRTLAVAGRPNDVWTWDYNGEFSAAGLGARRIPTRIVQTAPKTTGLPVQAVDYLYDSCLGGLGLVRLGVRDDDPQELLTQRLQDQHPSRFTFAWYARDSFGRVYDLRLYDARRDGRRYAYTPRARTEYFRLKPDGGNLSGYDPASLTPDETPFDPAGNVRFRRDIAYAPDGKTPRDVLRQTFAYDLDDRLAGIVGSKSAACSYGTVGDWTRATGEQVEGFDGLDPPLRTPNDTFVPGDPLGRRVRNADGGCTDTFFDGGQPLVERDHDRSGRLLRTRVDLLGARGTEAVTTLDAHGRARIDWLLDDGQGHPAGSIPGDAHSP